MNYKVHLARSDLTPICSTKNPHHGTRDRDQVTCGHCLTALAIHDLVADALRTAAPVIPLNRAQRRRMERER